MRPAFKGHTATQKDDDFISLTFQCLIGLADSVKVLRE